MIVAYLCSACDGASPPKPQVVTHEEWTVSAHTPVLLDGGLIMGSVTFERLGGAQTRGGGVCLVADLHNAFPCSTQTDCGAFPTPDGGYHYCAGVNGSTHKTCWTRPGGGSAYCHRNPANAPGTYSTSAVPAIVDGKKTRWLGYACLANESMPMGCGTTDPAQFVIATSPSVEVQAP